MGREDGLRPRVVYSPAYDITFFGLEMLHPFDPRKYSHAWHEIERAAGAGVADIVERPSRPISDEELLTVHGAGFLERLDWPQYVAAALEVPLPGWASVGLIRYRVLLSPPGAKRGVYPGQVGATAVGPRGRKERWRRKKSRSS